MMTETLTVVVMCKSMRELIQLIKLTGLTCPTVSSRPTAPSNQGQKHRGHHSALHLSLQTSAVGPCVQLQWPSGKEKAWIIKRWTRSPDSPVKSVTHSQRWWRNRPVKEARGRGSEWWRPSAHPQVFLDQLHPDPWGEARLTLASKNSKDRAIIETAISWSLLCARHYLHWFCSLSKHVVTAWAKALRWEGASANEAHSINPILHMKQ